VPARVPDALLLITTGCPHCPAVLAGLSELVKRGAIGKLEVVNLNARPDVAQALNVRSAPWLRLGEFEFEGLHSPAELQHWAERATQPEGMGDYLTALLKGGQLAKTVGYLKRHPQHLATLARLLGSGDLDLTVRIGISAVFEELEGHANLRAALDTLAAFTGHADAAIRADSCHLLALTHDPRATALIEPLLGDAVAPVREAAAEALATLAERTRQPSAGAE
jgi:hypothetical protein